MLWNTPSLTSYHLKTRAFLDAIGIPLSVSEWVSDSFRFGESYCISELCELVQKAAQTQCFLLSISPTLVGWSPLPTRLRITASFPSQIKLFPNPNMGASITQRAIKIGRKEQIQLEKDTSIKTGKIWPSSPHTPITRCLELTRSWVIAQNSSVFPLPITGQWLNQYCSNSPSIFLQYFPPTIMDQTVAQTNIASLFKAFQQQQKVSQLLLWWSDGKNHS